MSFWVGLSMRKKSERGESRKNERRCSFQEVCYLGEKLEIKQRGSTVEERGNEVVNREGLSTPGKGCLWKSQRK